MLAQPWWVARRCAQCAGTIIFPPNVVKEFVLAPWRSSASSGSRCPALLTGVGVLCRPEPHCHAQCIEGQLSEKERFLRVLSEKRVCSVIVREVVL